MNPLDFYKFGMQLANSANAEVEWRSVINRLYYGLHHEACSRYFREYPLEQPLEPNISRHRQLIDRYGMLRVNGADRIKRFLKQLLFMRNKSDYELLSPLKYGESRHRGRVYSGRQLMRFAVSMAEELLAELENFSPGEADDSYYRSP